MAQSVPLRDGISPQSSASRKKTEPVVPLWEAARTRRLRSIAHDAGATR
ncbi:hypothetical protein AB0G67_18315 [Streptomyces sp. NPDC021056]